MPSEAERNTAFEQKFTELFQRGYVVIPRELTQIRTEEVAAIHQAQLQEISRRFPGWDGDSQQAANSATASSLHDLMKKKLAGGFLGVQLLKPQLEMEFDARVEDLYRRVFSRIYGKPYQGKVWVWLERSNVSFAQPLRGKIGQAGALPHIDDNPWAAPLDVTKPYDEATWEPTVRVKGLFETRPMPKDRPVQAFVALTDCDGGPMNGGMGVCTDGDFWPFLKNTPPHGRNGRWGKLTRIYPKPGGVRMKQLSKSDREAVYAAHHKALAAIEYPAYRAGDIVMWLRERLHAGPQDNTSGRHSARMYLGGLPDNVLNRDAMLRQWQKVTAGVQQHGRLCDRTEKADVRALLTKEMRSRAGEDLSQKLVGACSGGGGASPKKLPDNTCGQAGAPASCSKKSEVGKQTLRDCDIFEVTETTKGLGFKNATVIAALKIPIPNFPLNVGKKVFVKIGENIEAVQYAIECSQLRHLLGLAAAPTTVVWVKPTIDWAAVADRSKAGWGKGVRLRLAKTTKDCSVEGAIPAFVSSAFQGSTIVESVDAVVGNMEASFEFLKVLIFRKFVGCADTNGRNILVGSFETGDGIRILSVDETPASNKSLVKGLAKGLQTAQAINREVLAAAANAMCSQPVKLAIFLEKLKRLTSDECFSNSLFAREDLALVHAREPFTDATLAILRSDDQTRVLALASRLKLQMSRKRKMQ